MCRPDARASVDRPGLNVPNPSSGSKAGHILCTVNPTVHLLEPEVRELIREKRYSELREALHGVPMADVAEILAALEPPDAALGFRFLQRDDAAEAFAYLPAEQQQSLIESLGAEASLAVVEAMDPDDRARLLDELPDEVARRLIASLSPESRRTTQAILGYPARSVGRLMTPDYVSVRSDWTVARAMDHVRRTGRDAETINVLYVTDEHGMLIDDIRLRQLILSEPDVTIESIRDHEHIALRADQPREEAVEALNRYDRVALPVTDSRGTLLGIVTHDDVADVAQAEATEDMQKLGAVEPLDEPYMATPVLRLVRKRGTWLVLLFASELLTSNVLAHYESEIARAAVLSIFIPAIISSGGNSGSQASTLVIRAIALNEVKLGDWFRVLRREVVCGLLLGLIIGAVGVLRIHIWGWLGWWVTTKKDELGHPLIDPATNQPVLDMSVQEHYSLLALTILCALCGCVLWGSLMGAMLPFLLKRIGLDPAASSTPFVATLVDVTGIFLYFTAATVLLRGVLL